VAYYYLHHKRLRALRGGTKTQQRRPLRSASRRGAPTTLDELAAGALCSARTTTSRQRHARRYVRTSSPRLTIARRTAFPLFRFPLLHFTS
jgi:hypothetical protein